MIQKTLSRILEPPAVDAINSSDSNHIAIRLALTLGFHSKPGRFARDSNPLTDLPGGKLPTPDKSGDRTCGFF